MFVAETGMGNLHACNELRERRPATLRDDPPGGPPDRYEYLHVERFFVAWAALGLADHHGSQLTRPVANSQARAREIDQYEVRRASSGILLGVFFHSLFADDLERGARPGFGLAYSRLAAAGSSGGGSW